VRLDAKNVMSLIGGYISCSTLRQFRNALSVVRCLFLCRQAADHGGTRPVRRIADQIRPMSATSRASSIDLSLLFPEPPPPGTCGLRRGRCMGALAGMLDR